MCESISPLDDLAFDMYQDPEVAHIIRLLDQRKQDAARQERLELARTLKQAIADLQKVWRSGLEPHSLDDLQKVWQPGLDHNSLDDLQKDRCI